MPFRIRMHLPISLLGLALAMIPAGRAAADAAAVRAALGYFPASSQLAVVLPSAEALDKEVEALAKEDAAITAGIGLLIGEIGNGLKQHGAKRLQDVLTGVGAKPDAPLAIFLDFRDGRINWAAAAPVGDAAKAKETISSAPEWGEFTAVALPGGAGEAQFNEGANLGYFLDGAHALLASSEELLKELGGGKASPYAAAYGGDGAPGTPGNELAVVAKLDALLASGALDRPDIKAYKPVVEFFAGFLDEAHLAISLDQKPGYVRLAGRDKSGAEAPKPLTLHKTLPTDAVGALNLRYTQGLLDFGVALAGAITGNPTEVKNQAALAPLVTAQLRDELALAVMGLNESRQPRLLIAIHATNQQGLLGLLGMAGVKQTPRFNHKDIDVVGSPDVSGIDVYAAGHNNTVLLANDADVIKTGLDRLLADGGPADSVVPGGLAGAGNFGLLYLDQKRLGEALSEVLPILTGMDLGQGNLQFSLGQQDAFRSATITLSEGVTPVLKSIVQVVDPLS